MAKNIYVGNLVWDATQDDLYTLFQEYGTVTRAQVIMDKETGRSRGFGFVEMNDDAEADKAIEALNNFSFNGRPLTVNEAKPREDRGGSGAGRGSYGGGAARGRGGYGGGGGGGGRGYGGGDRY
jgi:RNA recognition motif-containing protein